MFAALDNIYPFQSVPHSRSAQVWGREPEYCDMVGRLPHVIADSPPSHFRPPIRPKIYYWILQISWIWQIVLLPCELLVISYMEIFEPEERS